MDDMSIWEADNPLRKERREGIAFGRVTRVYPSEGFVEVKTFGSSGSKGDNHIPKCQWLNLDSNQDAKSAVIPQENTFCLVFFVEGEPFAFGFFDPLAQDGNSTIDEETQKLKLTAGDRLIRTTAKNYIIVRTTGAIEIESTPGNFIRLFGPGKGVAKDLLRIQNRNFQYKNSGGIIHWTELNRNRDTLWVSEHADNVKRANIIAERKGKVGGELLHQVDYGAPGQTYAEIPQPVKTTTIKNDGETVTHIRPAGQDDKGVKVTSKPSGDHEVQINDHTNMKVSADGTTTLDVNNGKVKIEIGSSGKISITAEADVSLENKGKLDVFSEGEANISAQNINIDGTGGKGKGAILQALGFPDAISDFTGLPIQQASTTVKISK